jgi:glycosyltransferase involved in cell wall biosynthesis
MQKKIALLHRYPADQIKSTNAAFPYLREHRESSFGMGECGEYRGLVLIHPRMDVLTFKTFDRLSTWKKFWKSLWWIVYAPALVAGRGYDVIYCDDSYPFYPALVKLVSPRSKVVIRLGDLHLMYHYSGLAYKVLHFFEKIAWLLADTIVAISEPMAEYIASEINHSDIRVVLDPVDPDDFKVKGLCSGSVMFHGTLTKNKNIDLLIEAAKRLPEVDFVVIGGGPDMKRLESIAPKNVFFQGWVPFKDVARHISECAIGVALRSDNPGNEYVVTSPFIQYGVMGKACLVTRRRVFGDYRWQFSGVDEMVEKIKALTDHYTHDQEGKKLREFVLKNHDAKKIAEEIWQILS